VNGASGSASGPQHPLRSIRYAGTSRGHLLREPSIVALRFQPRALHLWTPANHLDEVKKIISAGFMGRHPQTPNFKTANAVPARIHKRQ